MSPFWTLLDLTVTEVVVTTGAVRRAKAPVKLSPATNQHPVVLQAGSPSCHITNNVKALKGKNATNYTYMKIIHPNPIQHLIIIWHHIPHLFVSAAQ